MHFEGYTFVNSSNWCHAIFRSQDITIRGIGIHGTNDPSSIGGRTTEGCVRLANSDLDSLRPMLKVGMVVTIEPASSDRKANGEVVIESGQARAVITETIEDTEPANEPANEATIAENPKPQPSNNKEVEPNTEEVWHTVVDGELLGRIARSYGVTIADIKRLNPDIDVDRISIGQRIRISDGTSSVTRTEVETTTTTTAETTAEAPAAAVEAPNSEGEVWYTIVDGDLVGRVAARYGTTAKRIAELNPDINIDQVSIGQRIRIK